MTVVPADVPDPDETELIEGLKRYLRTKEPREYVANPARRVIAKREAQQ